MKIFSIFFDKLTIFLLRCGIIDHYGLFFLPMIKKNKIKKPLRATVLQPYSCCNGIYIVYLKQ